MALAPFVASYRALDLAQHHLCILADRRAEGGHSLGCVPLAEEREVRLIEVRRRVIAAAAKQGVGCAGIGGFYEAVPQFALIIPGHQRAVNDTGYIVPVRIEIHLGEVARHVLQLAGEPISLGVERLPQAELDFGEVPVVYLPGRERARAAPGAGVGDVEDVAELRHVAGVVHERDALRAAPDIAAHGIVPHLVARAGRGPRPLGVDHELVGERVLVQPRNSAEQRSPLDARAHSPPQ